jgi:hypothetical protein
MTRSKALVVSLILGVALTLFVLTQVQEIEASPSLNSGDASNPITNPRSPAAPDDITGGLIGHWSFDDGADPTNDDSGSGHDGDLIGEPTFTTTVPAAIGGGTALVFDDIDDYVEVQGDENDFDLEQLTVAFWIKSPGFTDGYEGLVTKGDDAWRIHEGDGSGYVEFHVDDAGGGGTTLRSTQWITDDVWHHFAATYDGTTMVIYIDGVLDISAPASVTIPDNDSPVTIGTNGHHTGRVFNGLMDEVRIYDRALTAGEVAQLYTNAPDRCFAEITGDGVTDFASNDASAVQDALDALAPTSDTVKVAGTCAGVQRVHDDFNDRYYTQTLYIDHNEVTVRGGYTHTNWLADPDPAAFPTVLDAQGAGRVVFVPYHGGIRHNLTLNGLVITHGDALSNTVGTCGDHSPQGGGGVCLGSVDNFTIQNCTIYDNVAEDGGGINHHGGGDVILVDTTVVSNTASTVGGGIYNRYNGLELYGSTVSGNSAEDGAGIYISMHDLTVVNTTISGNTAGVNGGGLYTFGHGAANGGTVVASSIVSNTAGVNGGGIYQIYVTLEISNTLVAYNSDGGGNAPDCDGTLTSGDYNLIQDATGCTLSGTLTHVITGTDPLLGPLADNGGETETHALPEGSPAVDSIPAGTNGCGTAIPADQRGVTRPQGTGCDIGAYELEYVCFAEITGNDETDFFSVDANAVQAALDALAPSSDTVKLAGTCAGVEARGGVTQTVFVSRSVTFQGGYSPTNWLDTPDPTAYTTTLDAARGGRVAFITGTVDVTLDGLLITGGDGGQSGGTPGNATHNHGGAIYLASGGALTVANATVYSNTIIGSNDQGGALAMAGTATAVVTNTTFRENVSPSGQGGAIFMDDSTNVLTIRHSVLEQNGSGTNQGGAIFNSGGAVEVYDSTFEGNNSGSNDGGAIYSFQGDVSIADSNFISNTATSGGGGAIYHNGSVLTATGSTFLGNSAEDGGAIFVSDGQATVAASQIVSNTATHFGAGINTSGTFTLTDSLISGNTASSWGGGVINSGSAIVQGNTFANNVGEGAALFNASSGQMDVARSAFYDHIATNGTIQNRGMVTITNSTVSNNDGDGINNYHNGGTVRLLHTTVISHTGRGVMNKDSAGVGIVDMAATLVAYNTLDCNSSGTFNDLGYNLVADSTCITAVTSFDGDPLLGPLADNGGFTWTHLPLPLSPVIDAIPAGSCSLATDQRGTGRPVDAACDVGAVELAQEYAPIATADAYTTTEETELVIAASGVLSNDLDGDWDALTATTVRVDPTGGALALSADGSFVYTPTLDFFGVDTFTYVVSDGTLTDTVQVSLTVTNVNDPPVADAGDNQTVASGAPVTLDGSGSEDPDLDSLDYGWTQTGGPAVSLVGSTTAAPTFTPTFTTTTSLTFTLVVTDVYNVDSPPDAVVVTVNPRLLYLPLIIK